MIESKGFQAMCKKSLPTTKLLDAMHVKRADRQVTWWCWPAP